MSLSKFMLKRVYALENGLADCAFFRINLIYYVRNVWLTNDSTLIVK